ncbi:MBL fold metallo-hydrolase [Halorientalis sp. IM1011]|uniref:MBL fold metallo-hydrolase n=1 Tax=Halorientalis sp. IM1011 TaxID=1932360 RepID=UPI00097CD100|nr:MBL fold metallo-hydrolase [Halorientalis sp. IM1011]AQL43184.1 MBL fold metallo-hydrolase [Halorientalis sp. IM1011]
MAIGDHLTVDGVDGVTYVDTGMYDTAEYGAVYIVDADEPAIVDSGIGTNYEAILDGLRAAGIAPEDLATIALTHVHLDHAGGAGYLAEACPNADVVIHESGARHLVEPSGLIAGTKRAVGDQWEFYADPKPIPEDRIREITGGDVLDLGDRELRAHHTPGHAPHQVVFELPDESVVFTGDAAGIYVPELDSIHQTSPPSDFDLEGCLGDLHTIRDCDPDVLCYGHFGPAAADDRLREYADVLTEWVAAVERKRDELSDDDAVIEYFGDTTSMTGVWGERKASAEARMNTRGVLAYLDTRSE